MRAAAAMRPGCGSTTRPLRRAPKEVGFAAVDGVGVHRVWYVGGRWAYASVMPDGWSDFIFMALDVSDPASPEWAGSLLAAGDAHRRRRDADVG